MDKLQLFVEIDVGTVAKPYFIINPIFALECLRIEWQIKSLLGRIFNA